MGIAGKITHSDSDRFALKKSCLGRRLRRSQQ
jgi:hypothetical protein